MIPLPIWFTMKNVMRVLPALVVIGLVLYGIHLVREADFQRGAASVQVKWDAQENERKKQILVLQGKMLHQKTIHEEETQKLTHELTNAQRHYEKVIDDLAADYRKRLLLSEERTTIYRRQANSGPVECGNLASHASKLDSTLEEGRSLVAELRTTLELRDQQVKSLGGQLVSDRKLFE